jgi:hypothetical protein
MRLKIAYKADDTENVVKWNPENFSVHLNGLELDLVTEVNLTIVNGENPLAQITFCPDEIDIDADTLVALRALLDAAPEISEPDENDDHARDAVPGHAAE